MRNGRDRLSPWRVVGSSLLVWAGVAAMGGSIVEGTLWADESGTDATATDSASLEWPKPSLDSVVAWTDQFYCHQWRIQAHVETEECRLLDADDQLIKTGTFEQCIAELDSIKQQQQLPPMQGEAVVLLHGLAAPRWSMKLLASHLEREGGYTTFAMDYASLRTNIDNHASSLANVLRSLEGFEKIHLIGHSMGNIVIRRYLAGNDSAPHMWRPDPRIGRIVMIAPPNHGSITATRLSNTSAFQAVFGDSGRQLGVQWSDLEKRLVTPSVEFGVIAGGFNNVLGLNPFLPGDDDGRITVTTTRLAGARDFLVVPAMHELIANDPRVFEYTHRFLALGYFVSADQRQPITADKLAERSDPETARR